MLLRTLRATQETRNVPFRNCDATIFCQSRLRSITLRRRSMSTKLLRTFGLSILILSALAGPSGAQVGKTYRTLEARIQQADIVVRGDIADLKRTVLVPRMGKRENTVWPDGIVEYR